MSQVKDARSGSGKKETLVEEGTTFRGSIDSDCHIVVNGCLEGEISGPALHVSSTGRVSGTVKVREILSEGILEGEFEADVVCLSGKVKDKTVIRARSLDVKIAASQGGMELVFGECQLDIGDVPSKQTALSEARSLSPRGTPASVPTAGTADGKKDSLDDDLVAN
jgi:cytoskeletal protein CcmA (bactofilin family)